MKIQLQVMKRGDILCVIRENYAGIQVLKGGDVGHLVAYDNVVKKDTELVFWLTTNPTT